MSLCGLAALHVTQNVARVLPAGAGHYCGSFEQRYSVPVVMVQKVHDFTHPHSLGPAFIFLGLSSIYSDSCGYMQLTYPNDSDQNILLLSISGRMT
ncbi:hypothetical protein BDV35DRAFT_364654 [Aspergillus flavus]|uniref:Uncharacterized protein n=1 Tax=Aspergillus flavus TaxID=5059 RepID=A0A5N6GM30_ASPFL|nr:hypothetical protein BDV35DRAFT_364654 [Aspergillus flavus]